MQIKNARNKSNEIFLFKQPMSKNPTDRFDQISSQLQSSVISSQNVVGNRATESHSASIGSYYCNSFSSPPELKMKRARDQTESLDFCQFQKHIHRKSMTGLEQFSCSREIKLEEGTY
jgi:hypothetical protein